MIFLMITSLVSGSVDQRFRIYPSGSKYSRVQIRGYSDVGDNSRLVTD